MRVDDSSIANDEDLLRRIRTLPGWTKIESDGSIRPSSVAFLDRRSGELSVDIASLTTPEKSLAGFEGDGLAAVQCFVPRSFGHAIVRDPIIPDNPAHALVCSEGMQAGQIKKAAKSMATAARWIALPKG